MESLSKIIKTIGTFGGLLLVGGVFMFGIVSFIVTDDKVMELTENELNYLHGTRYKQNVGPIDQQCGKVDELIKTQKKLTMEEIYDTVLSNVNPWMWKETEPHEDLGKFVKYNGVKYIDGYCFISFSSRLDYEKVNVFKYAYRENESDMAVLSKAFTDDLYYTYRGKKQAQLEKSMEESSKLATIQASKEFGKK